MAARSAGDEGNLKQEKTVIVTVARYIPTARQDITMGAAATSDIFLVQNRISDPIATDAALTI